MKKIGDYTCRGQVVSQGYARITLFDGAFDTAYRVVAFHVSPRGINQTDDCYGTLYTDDSNIGADWNWQRQDQIAWAGLNTGTTYAEAGYSVIDPDNLVVEDLFVYGREAGGDPINYMVVLEKYDVGDWRGALAMVRNRSQA